MKVKRRLLCVVWVVCAGCSRGNRSVAGAPIVIEKTVFRPSTVIAPRPVLGGYVERAGRVTILDATSGAEVFGQDRAVSEPREWVTGVADLSALAKVEAHTFRVIGADQEREFVLAADTSTGREDSVVGAGGSAFAFFSKRNVEALRYLGGGKWDQQLLDKGKIPNAALMSWNSDGTKLFVVGGSSGGYRAFVAPKASEPIGGVAKDCGDFTRTGSPAVSLWFDSGRDFVALGTSKGEILFRDAVEGDSCLEPGSWDKVTVGGDFGGLAVSCDSDSLTCLAGTYDRGMYRLTRGAVGSSWAVTRLVSVCTQPLSWQVYGKGTDRKLAVLCVGPGAVEAGSGPLLRVQVVKPAKDVGTVEIGLDEAPSVLALDGEGESLLVLINSGIGVLWKYDLRDGSKTETQGIFAGGIW